MAYCNSNDAAIRDQGVVRAALGFAPVVLLVFGLAYALAATALGGALFPYRAQGSLIERDSKVVGSEWVAQGFSDARYFQPRPSAASYDMMALAGSNQARSNPKLRARLAQAQATVAARENIPLHQVPIELMTQSGSGSDPHISPEGARVQIARVAQARGVAADTIASLVQAHVEPPQFGLLGQARVNVLRLNLALDAITLLKR